MENAAAVSSAHAAPPPDMAADLVRLKSPEEYAASHGHIFPGEVAARYFLRMHRKRLIEAGALLMIRGRWLIDPAPFGEVFVEIAKERAMKAAA